MPELDYCVFQRRVLYTYSSGSLLFSPSPAQSTQLNMKLSISYLAIASTVSVAAATSCTPDVASPWPYKPDEPCETAACAADQAYANCVAVSAISGGTCVHGRDLLEKRGVDLDCASGETCTFFTDNSLLCLEVLNGW